MIFNDFLIEATTLWEAGNEAVSKVLAYANGTVFANTTVSNTESIVLAKGPTELLTGANMKAAPVEYRG